MLRPGAQGHARTPLIVLAAVILLGLALIVLVHRSVAHAGAPAAPPPATASSR